jgi:hypothetical protein
LLSNPAEPFVTKLSNNAKGALFIVVLGFVYLAEALGLDFGTAQMPQEGFVPVLIGMSLLFCCAVLIIREVFFAKVAVPESHDQIKGERDTRAPLRKQVFLLTGVLLLYPLIMPYGGFFATTTLLLYLVFRIFEYRNHVWSLAVAVLCVAIIYGVFEKWLTVLIFPEAKFLSMFHTGM